MMPKPFDVTTKELLESDPRAWLELLLGRELGEVRILNDLESPSLASRPKLMPLPIWRKLEQLTDRVLEVTAWEELLAQP
jgi:hypothetical protein